MWKTRHHFLKLRCQRIHVDLLNGFADAAPQGEIGAEDFYDAALVGEGGLLEDGEILHEAVVDDVRYDLIDKIDLSNEGEIPQYYVEDSHEAIIDPDPHNRGLPSQVHRLFPPGLITHCLGTLEQDILPAPCPGIIGSPKAPLFVASAQMKKLVFFLQPWYDGSRKKG